MKSTKKLMGCFFIVGLLGVGCNGVDESDNSQGALKTDNTNNTTKTDCPMISLPNPDVYDCEGYTNDQGCPALHCVPKKDNCPLPTPLDNPMDYYCTSNVSQIGCPSGECIKYNDNCPMYSLPDPEKFLCEGYMKENGCSGFKCCEKTDKECLANKCEEINTAYNAAIDNARNCSENAQRCNQFVARDLKCGIGTAVNANADLVRFEKSWKHWGCDQNDWNCPMYSHPPLNMKRIGACDFESGKCVVKWVKK